MNKERIETFSDGVVAIIITIMVLEFKVPHSSEWSYLQVLLPHFLGYIISFLMIGTYWGNHHHLLHTIKSSNNSILLANLNLLFWLSLIPFATSWMGENAFSGNTIILYAIILIMCSISYSILQKTILNVLDKKSEISIAVKSQNKKIIAAILSNIIAISFANYYPIISWLLFLFQSLIWLIPDKNIEKIISKNEK
jgi:uncharacterized membrane protein